MPKSAKPGTTTADSPAPQSGASPHPWRLGAGYLVRTVAYYVVGRLTFVGEHELVFEDAAWVADTGRFADALKSGQLNEVEPFAGPAIVGRGSVCDAAEWPHQLPLAQK